MKDNDIKDELKALRKELKNLEKINKKNLEKIEKITTQNKELKKELKKNDAPKIILNKEQQQLLSNLLKDTNTPSSSSH